MKNKILIAIPIMLIIVCIFSLNVFANENDAVNNTGISEQVVSDDSLETENVNATTLPDNSTPELPQEDNITDNIFELAFNEVKRYLSEILCLLAFISSIIVAFAYKRGLVPILENSVGAISRAITKIKEKSEESEKVAKDNYDFLVNRVKEYEGTIASLQEKIQELTNFVSPLGDEMKNNKFIEELIVSQTNMLYDVFMTSSLPAYQKDKVEAHFKKMMEDLRCEE